MRESQCRGNVQTGSVGGSQEQASGYDFCFCFVVVVVFCNAVCAVRQLEEQFLTHFAQHPHLHAFHVIICMYCIVNCSEFAEEIIFFLQDIQGELIIRVRLCEH